MRGKAPAVKRSFENYLNVLDFGYKIRDILSYINHAEDSANAVETLHKMGKQWTN